MFDVPFQPNATPLPTETAGQPHNFNSTAATAPPSNDGNGNNGSTAGENRRQKAGRFRTNIMVTSINPEMSNIAELSVDHIAERAKRELQEAETALERARRQFDEAMARYALAKNNFVEADLQRNCSWNTMYKRLIEYKEKNGDVLVLTSKDSPPELKKLAKWVQNQRVHYKYHMNGDKKHIKEHRIDALNGIGFVWNILDYAWDRNFSALESYYSEHGDFNVPKKHDPKLNNFVTNLRKAMRRKREGLLQKELTEERITRLDSINFNWDVKHLAKQRSAGENVQYDYLYELLVDFKKNYGHVHVSKMMPIWRKGDEKPIRKEFRRLPFFIASVRSEQELFAQGKPCALDEEKVKNLTELGIKWKRPASEPRRNCSVKRKKPKAGNDNDPDASADVVNHAEPIADEGMDAATATVEVPPLEAATVDVPIDNETENYEECGVKRRKIDETDDGNDQHVIADVVHDAEPIADEGMDAATAEIPNDHLTENNEEDDDEDQKQLHII